jgi:6-phosphofructokinase 1
VVTKRWPLPVAVLFSGSEAPGMNAFLRNVVCLGLNRHGALVLGVKDGFAGLVQSAERVRSGELTVAGIQAEITGHPGLAGLKRPGQSLVLMDSDSVSGLLERGGIVLGCSRCPEFADPEVRWRAIELLWNLGAGAVVVCGGDGSLAGAACLARESELRVVGVPATLDNDVPMTEIALGVDTAANTLTAALGHFSDTAAGGYRIVVLEVTGRNSGELARMAALASGAEIVVTPEFGLLTMNKINEIAAELERAMLRGRRHAMVLVAAGVLLDPQLDGQASANPTMQLARELNIYFRARSSSLPGLDVQGCVLGSLPRGGVPLVADRILAARFAEAAWEVITSPDERSGVLGMHNGLMLSQDFKGRIDPERTECARRFYKLQKDVSKV